MTTSSHLLLSNLFLGADSAMGVKLPHTGRLWGGKKLVCVSS